MRWKMLACAVTVALVAALSPFAALPAYAKCKTIEVALTVVDASDTWSTTVLANSSYTFSAVEGATVADLLAKAGYTAGTQEESRYEDTVYFESWGYPNFLGKVDNGLAYTDEGYAWWNCFLNDDDTDATAYALSSELVDGGHYQYIFGSYGTWTGYTSAVPDPLEGSGGVQPTKTDVNVFDVQKASVLAGNLAARFAKGGADDAIGSNMLPAAVALNAAGRGGEIDAAAVAANLAADEASWTLEAGTLAKYILALSAAGVDCTQVEIAGTSRNLLEELAELSQDYTNYWGIPAVLFVLNQTEYMEYAEAAQANILVDTLLSTLGEDGLLDGGFGPDVQLTAQAVNALVWLPWRVVVMEDLDGAIGSDNVAAFIDGAGDALRAKLQGDGGFCKSIDVTADVVTALVALGIDPAGKEFKTPNGSTPAGYLVAHATEGLDGMVGAYDEAMASAATLLALTAADTEENVYLLKDVVAPEPQPEPQPEPTPEPQPAPAPVDPDEPDGPRAEGGLPATGDAGMSMMLLVGALAVAGMALVVAAAATGSAAPKLMRGGRERK